MGLPQHLNTGNKMKEDGEAAKMDAPTPPADLSIERGRHHGDTRRRIQNRRNSQPKQIHTEVYLKGVTAQYTVMQITWRPGLSHRNTWSTYRMSQAKAPF
jgi:hypothetical protein